jgi:GTPase
MLEPEQDDGNIEYKRYLINIDSERFENLSTQMMWRLSECNNEAIYYLGVNDNGTIYNMTEQERNETLFNFMKLVNNNNAEIINFEENIYIKITIRRKNTMLPEIRVVLLGNTQSGSLNSKEFKLADLQSGKTTFLSNILLSKLDTNNDARIYLMNHKHELETKKTSSFNCHYENYMNYKFSFMEAPGYKEYQKMKYKILLGSHPDICLLFTNQNNEIEPFDLFIVKKLNIPHIIVNVFDSSSIYNCKKLIDKKIFFEELLGLKSTNKTKQGPTVFNILNIYPHTDLGIIMSGYLVSGLLEINKPIYWTTNLDTLECKINSIHINNEPINKCETNQMLTVCIKPLNNYNTMKKHKNGFLSDKFLNKNHKINFQFLNFSNTKLLNNLTGYCENRLVKLTNIIEENNEFTATVDNYYNDSDIIIIDYENIKGICLIKYLEYL